MKLWKLSQDTHIFANTHTNTHTPMHVFDLYLNLFEHVYWHDCMFVTNRYIITWMLHQIFTYSDKVRLAACYNDEAPYLPPLPHSLPYFWMNELTNKWGIYLQVKLTKNFPLSIYPRISYIVFVTLCLTYYSLVVEKFMFS